PELLDWLAAEYMGIADCGLRIADSQPNPQSAIRNPQWSRWDTKRLVKTLVMSDAFRRDSRQTAAEQAKDLQNRWLARGPRLRLAAEQLRDNALFAGGLIDLTMGGRGVRPYQPPNI